MPDAAEVALEPLRAGLVPVPAVPQVGVCEICHSAADTGSLECRPCRQATAETLAWPILPITMSVHGELLHQHMWGYKDDQDATTRRRMSRRLAALVAIFLRNHATCLGEFDSVAAVPSVDRRALTPIIGQVKVLKDAPETRLAALRTDGRERRADRYRPERDVSGERVLVLDDTFTTGASLFSACAALRDAGAEIVGPLVIARHIKRDWDESRQLLTWLDGRPWDETCCCRCAGEMRDPGAML